MADVIALNKRDQKKMKKSDNMFKDLLKKGEVKIVEKKVPKIENPKKPVRKEKTEKPKKKGKTKEFKSTRGIVYFSHIPHGFYEDQMKSYFSQFGKVTNLKLARSRKSGKSKGYAFIEFLIPEVAKIVAETMDGYLMCKRLLKAKYIAPEEQKFCYFSALPVTAKKFPHKDKIRKIVKKNREPINLPAERKATVQRLKNTRKTVKKLKEASIEYDFKPVDMPDYLLDKPAENSDASNDSDEKPVLEIDESDSDITFVTPPGVKKVIKPKRSEGTPTSKPKAKKNLGGTMKKSAKKQLVIPKNSKKLQLLKTNILNSDQVKVVAKPGNDTNKGKRGKRSSKKQKSAVVKND